MSFQQGLSGLSAAAKNLEVIGNNISNANTIGAKASRAEFADMYASAVGGSGGVGIGSRLAAVTQDHTQGSITTTGNNLDLAINGKGYFQVQDTSIQGGANAGGEISVLYARNGQFKSDREGFIVNNDGLRLLGYPADATGIIRSGQLDALKIPSSRIEQKPTTRVDMAFNLDAADPSKSITTFNPVEGGSFNYSTSMNVVDRSGKDVQLSLYFKKSTSNKWDVYATANGVPVRGGTNAAIGSLDFTTSPDGSGPPAVTRSTGAPAPLDPTRPQLTIDGAALAAALNDPALNKAKPAGVDYAFENMSVDLGGATQRAGDYLVGAIKQDGYPVGTLSSFSFDKAGVLTARYSNGEVRQTAQLALASFRNPQGLTPAGGNAWAESKDSGAKSMHVPGTGASGEIMAGALEESNVDVTAELVSLITAQRTYQANAQSIKAQDQVMQSFVNMR
ncbi:MAG: flagellar hook protein FlgE [Pseudomonadota bacterium]|jgi:flagellar hook protein FlgE